MALYIEEMHESRAYNELSEDLQSLDLIQFKDKYYSYWIKEDDVEGVFMAMSPEGRYIFTLEGEIKVV